MANTVREEIELLIKELWKDSDDEEIRHEKVISDLHKRKVEIQSICPHAWEFHRDPAVNNDHSTCMICDKTIDGRM
jgi:ferredoxin-like protein FixX